MKNAKHKRKHEDFESPLDHRVSGPRRFFIRWSIYVVVLYVIVTLLTAKSFSSIRVAAPLQEGESVDLARSRSYQGQTSIYGWPIQWLLLHHESETPEQSGSMRLVRLKLSYVALLLDLAAVVCFLFATTLITQAFRERKLHLSSVVTVLISIASIFAVFYFSGRNFLE